VLIVDDNADAAAGLARLLRASGYAAVVAADGPAALAAAASDRPGCVLLDIGLPGMDGYDVARRLRDDAGLTDALIVAVSGYAPDPNRATAAGINHHLVKPLDLDALLALLAR
jgi:two-component system CheB/CheR fusion protein